jgi:hypothetical protein
MILGSIASLSQAEPRWCSITGRASSDTLIYPPIARAARVSGVVLSRVIFSPAGKVENVESISGPAMLADSVAQQLGKWTFRTTAQGDELCEAIVISEFRLGDLDNPLPEQSIPAAPPGLLRIRIDAETYVISCPGGTVIWTPASYLRYKIKQVISKIFGPRRPGPHCCGDSLR